MKTKDLLERSIKDLKELEQSLRKDLFKARFQNFTNQLDKTSAIPTARKNIARVLTVLRQKQTEGKAK